MRLRERSPALTATLLSEADFTAEPVERLDAPEPPTRAERRGHVRRAHRGGRAPSPDSAVVLRSITGSGRSRLRPPCRKFRSRWWSSSRRRRRRPAEAAGGEAEAAAETLGRKAGLRRARGPDQREGQPRVAGQEDRGPGDARGPSPADSGRSAEKRRASASARTRPKSKRRGRAARARSQARARRRIAGGRRTRSRRTIRPRPPPPRRRPRPPAKGARRRAAADHRGPAAIQVRALGRAVAGRRRKRRIAVSHDHLRDDQSRTCARARDSASTSPTSMAWSISMSTRAAISSAASWSRRAAPRTSTSPSWRRSPRPRPIPRRQTGAPSRLNYNFGRCRRTEPRSLNAEVIHPDALEIGKVIAPVVGRPHPVFRAFLLRHGVKLGRPRETCRGAARSDNR